MLVATPFNFGKMFISFFGTKLQVNGIGKISARREVGRERWRTMDFEPMPTTPAETARLIADDSRRWAEAVKLSGFKAD